MPSVLGWSWRRRSVLSVGVTAALLALGAAASSGAAPASSGPVWSAATELTLPADAQTPTDGGAADNTGGVSCPSAGNCVAVGSYDASAQGRGLSVSPPMVLTQTGGTWVATRIALPADSAAQVGGLYSVSCASVGNCAAVGGYMAMLTPVEAWQAMVVTETDGVWGQASGLVLPPNAAPANQMGGPTSEPMSVACPGPGDCVAVGYYTDQDNDIQAMVAQETNGVWGQASEITPPAGAVAAPLPGGTVLASVACPSASTCVAVGWYSIVGKGNSRSMVMTEKNGAWSRAKTVGLTTDPRTSVDSLSSVACSGVRHCVALGSFNYAVRYSSIDRSALISETNGSWGQPAPLGGTMFGANALACPSLGSCVAVGSSEWRAPKGDNVVLRATTVAQSGGTWATGATAIALPTNAKPVQRVDAGLTGVACTSQGHCVAVGDYSATNGGNTEVMVTTSQP
ncbi:MAG: hypothetical protein ABSG64_13785 [Solirubrobacteraceae bacterium]